MARVLARLPGIVAWSVVLIGFVLPVGALFVRSLQVREVVTTAAAVGSCRSVSCPHCGSRTLVATA